MRPRGRWQQAPSPGARTSAARLLAFRDGVLRILPMYGPGTWGPGLFTRPATAYPGRQMRRSALTYSVSAGQGAGAEPLRLFPYRDDLSAHGAARSSRSRPVKVWWVTGSQSRLVGHRKPDVCAWRQAKLLRGVARIDRQRDEPGAVGEGNDLAGRDRGEGLQIGNRQLTTAAADDQRRSEPDAETAGLRPLELQLNVADLFDHITSPSASPSCTGSSVSVAATPGRSA